MSLSRSCLVADRIRPEESGLGGSSGGSEKDHLDAIQRRQGLSHLQAVKSDMQWARTSTREPRMRESSQYTGQQRKPHCGRAVPM